MAWHISHWERKVYRYAHEYTSARVLVLPWIQSSYYDKAHVQSSPASPGHDQFSIATLVALLTSGQVWLCKISVHGHHNSLLSCLFFQVLLTLLPKTYNRIYNSIQQEWILISKSLEQLWRMVVCRTMYTQSFRENNKIEKKLHKCNCLQQLTF